MAEHRIPQDGRIKMTIEGRAVDLRVSTLPTQFGESVVLRVLDKSAVNLGLDNLGLRKMSKAEFVEQCELNGIFIVTGPTGWENHDPLQCFVESMKSIPRSLPKIRLSTRLRA